MYKLDQQHTCLLSHKLHYGPKWLHNQKNKIKKQEIRQLTAYLPRLKSNKEIDRKTSRNRGKTVNTHTHTHTHTRTHTRTHTQTHRVESSNFKLKNPGQKSVDHEVTDRFKVGRKFAVIFPTSFWCLDKQAEQTRTSRLNISAICTVLILALRGDPSSLSLLFLLLFPWSGRGDWAYVRGNSFTGKLGRNLYRLFTLFNTEIKNKKTKPKSDGLDSMLFQLHFCFKTKEQLHFHSSNNKFHTYCNN